MLYFPRLILVDIFSVVTCLINSLPYVIFLSKATRWNWPIKTSHLTQPNALTFEVSWLWWVFLLDRPHRPSQYDCPLQCKINWIFGAVFSRHLFSSTPTNTHHFEFDYSVSLFSDLCYSLMQIIDWNRLCILTINHRNMIQPLPNAFFVLTVSYQTNKGTF
jgi:hypothetical protein